MADYLRDEILAPLPCPPSRSCCRPPSSHGCRARPATGWAARPARGRCSGSSRARASRSCRSTGRTTSSATTRCSPRCSGPSSAGAIRCGPPTCTGEPRAWHEREGGSTRPSATRSPPATRRRAGTVVGDRSHRIAHGRVRSIRAWLARMSPEQVAAHAPLALTAAATHLVDGDRDRLEHWLGRAERLIAGGEEIEGRRPRPARSCARRSSAGHLGHGRRRGDGVRADVRGRPWHPLACLLRGAGLHLLGDRDRAVGLLEEGARRGGLAAPSAQVLCLAQLALIHADDDDWETAALLASRARAQLERADSRTTRARRWPSRRRRSCGPTATASRRPRTTAGGPRAARAARGPAALVRRRDARRARPHHGAPRRRGGPRALAGEAARQLRELPDAPLAARWVEAILHQTDASRARRPRRRSPTPSCACCGCSRPTSRSARWASTCT